MKPNAAFVGILAIVVAAAGLAPGAAAHDDADAPHMRCQSDMANTTLVCVYQRHQVTPKAGRPSRRGYADRARYELSCLGAEDTRTFQTTICRSGSGDFNAFQCWTSDAREKYLLEDGAALEFGVESTTTPYVFEGKALQEVLAKFLVNPRVGGRSHWLATSIGNSEEDIAAYATTCGLETEGGLSLSDLAGLLPVLALLNK